MSNVDESLMQAVSMQANEQTVGSTLNEQIMTDARATVTQTSGTTSHSQYPDYPKDDLGQFLSRRTKIANVVLQSTDVIFSIPSSTDPWALFLANSFIAAKTRDFQLLRGDMIVEGLMTSVPGAYGKYVVYAYPISPLVAESSSLFNPLRECYKQYIHVELDMSQSTNFTLHLPWIHPWDHGIVNGPGSQVCIQQWRLDVMCLQAVGTGLGTTVPTVDLSIYARLENPTLAIPYFQSGFDDMRKSANKKSVALLGGKPSDIASGISMLAKKASSIPMIGSLATPVAAGAAAVSNILNFFGFTRETNQQTPTTIVNRIYSNVANMDVQDTSEIAALSVSNTITIDPRVYGLHGIDESSTDFIYNKWSLVGDFAWTPDNAINTQLKVWPVTPFLSRSSMETGAVFTTAGFVGYPFTNWRARLEYRLLIPVSKFHRGKLQISFSPNLQGVVVDPTNNRFNQIIDVEDGYEFYFSVDYVHPAPMLPCIPHFFTQPIVSTQGANGMITVQVVNPLKAQNPLASTNVFVFARAVNCHFAIPRNVSPYRMNDGSLVYDQFYQNTELQGALGDGQMEAMMLPLVECPSDLNVKDVLVGETFDSVRCLMQKFTHLPLGLTPGDGPSTDVRRVFFNHFLSPPIQGWFNLNFHNAPNTNSQFTWFGYYVSLFHGVAGSTRIKIVNTTSASVQTRPYGAGPVPNVGNGGFSGFGTAINGYSIGAINPLSPIWTILSGEAAEITIPYYGRYLYQPLYYDASIDLWSGNESLIRVDMLEIPTLREADNNNLSYALFYAGGPDLRLHLFRGIRRIRKTVAPDSAFTSLQFGTTTL